MIQERMRNHPLQNVDKVGAGALAPAPLFS